MKIKLIFDKQLIVYNEDYVWNTSVLVHRNIGRKLDANSLSNYYKEFLNYLLK